MTKLKLTVTETKTRVCKLPEEKFDFLAHVGSARFVEDRARVPGYGASKKRVICICETISEATVRRAGRKGRQQIGHT